jgi:hypothetical protein
MAASCELQSVVLAFVSGATAHSQLQCYAPPFASRSRLPHLAPCTALWKQNIETLNPTRDIVIHENQSVSMWVRAWGQSVRIVDDAFTQA